MEEFETIREFERDGWHVEVSLAPDYDYRPGEDDDTYPTFEDASRYLRDYGWDEMPRDYSGEFLPRPILVDSRQGPLMVTPEEIARVRENTGATRKTIESDAAAIAGEDLTWAIVRVRATNGSVMGEDYLGGVEYDLREREPEKYVLETVENYGMVETAIEDGARFQVKR